MCKELVSLNYKSLMRNLLKDTKSSHYDLVLVIFIEGAYMSCMSIFNKAYTVF